MTATDPRATRSRQALIQAATRILDAAPTPDLGVSDIVREAGVSRPTFYQHFGDTAALIQAATITRLCEIFSVAKPLTLGTSWTEFARENFRAILAEMNKNRTFYTNVLEGVGGYNASNDTVEIVARRILDNSPLGPVLKSQRSPLSPKEHAHFMSAGAIWLIARRLLDSPEPLNTTELADHIGALLLSSSGVSHEDFINAYPDYA